MAGRKRGAPRYSRLPKRRRIGSRALVVRGSRAFSRRSAGTAFISGQLGNSRSLAYKTKRMSRRRWTSALLRNTMFKPHYRSVLNTGASPALLVGTGTATVSDLLPCLRLAGNQFWTVAGGAQPIDRTIAVPTFDTSSMVLRGGRYSITFATAGNDAVKIRLYLVYVRPNAETAVFNALTSVPLMWDPTHFPDFYQSFKLISTREFFLQPGGIPVDIVRSFRPQKIDYDAYNNDQGFLAYFFTASQTTDVDLVTQSITFTQSYSISFTGDIIN